MAQTHQCHQECCGKHLHLAHAIVTELSALKCPNARYSHGHGADTPHGCRSSLAINPGRRQEPIGTRAGHPTGLEKALAQRAPAEMLSESRRMHFWTSGARSDHHLDEAHLINLVNLVNRTENVILKDSVALPGRLISDLCVINCDLYCSMFKSKRILPLQFTPLLLLTLVNVAPIAFRHPRN